MPTLALNGVDLYYQQQGAGEGVVLVHGSLSDYRSWGFQVGPFSERYRVVTYSRRDHYPNPPVGAEYAATVHAADLADVIVSLELAPAHVVASSYGACVALLTAMEHPEIVRSLVLGEPPLLPWLAQNPEGRAFLEAQRQAMERSAKAFDAGQPEKAVQTFLDSVIGTGRYERLSPPARATLMDNAPELALEMRMVPDVYFPPLTPAMLWRVQAPALVLEGESSPRFFHLIGDELEKHLPRPDRATVPLASHSMHGMNPKAYNEAVLAFLSRH